MFLSCFLSACTASFQPALRGSCLLQQPHLACSCWHGAAQSHSQSSARVLYKALLCAHWHKQRCCTGFPKRSTAHQPSWALRDGQKCSAPRLGGTRSSIPYSLGPFVKLWRNVLNFLQGFFKAVFYPRPKKLLITGSSNRFRKRKGKQQPRSTQC